MGTKACVAVACALCMSSTALAWLPSTSKSFWIATPEQHRPSYRNGLDSGSRQKRIPWSGAGWWCTGGKRARSVPFTCSMDSPLSGANRVNGLHGGLTTGTRADTTVLKDNLPLLPAGDTAPVLSAGDDVCFESGCPSTVEPPHGTDPGELEIPALREIKSSTAGPTVWSEFSALAAETGAINLGQGFPDWDPPDFVVAAAHQALSEGFHQYTRTAGHPRLVQLLAKRYTKHFQGEIDPFSQVAITIGASQALYLAFQAILSHGDEVILLEPYFDLYLGQVKMAGGVVKPVPLQVENGEFRLDVEALRRVITPRTRAIVINTPHNPTGKVFSREELEAIAEVVRENPRMLVISDEVYKYMVYSGLGSRDSDTINGDAKPAAADAGGHAGQILSDNVDLVPSVNGASTGATGPLPALRHVHFATLDGMWDRTITLSSAGKTFSVTGWQVGWVLGPARVIHEIHTMLPYMQFCAATPLQEAMCIALVQAEQPYQGHASYYDWLRQQYAAKRARLEEALHAAGIRTLRGEGGFFLIGDISNVQVPEVYLEASTPAMPVMTRDWAFCRWMALEHNLVAIPTSPFFSAASRAKGIGGGLVRFCFCKTDETLDAAAEALVKMATEQQGGGSESGRMAEGPGPRGGRQYVTHHRALTEL